MRSIVLICGLRSREVTFAFERKIELEFVVRFITLDPLGLVDSVELGKVVLSINETLKFLS